MKRGAVAAALALVATVRAADASDLFTMLDWACDPDAANAAAVTADLLAACELTAGAATACATLSGTPTACQRLTAGAPQAEDCGSNALVVTITGDSGSTLGWTVSGTLTVKAVFTFTMTSTTCAATSISPPPDGGAGTYVGRAGVATATASFTASGTGSISFLGGTIFSASHQEACTRTLTANGHTSASANACHRRKCTTTTTTTTTGGARDAERSGSSSEPTVLCAEDAVLDGVMTVEAVDLDLE